ncbi:MAG: hypothetical protein JSV34_03570 [Candidatus Omnitrophota bacterium]|nr:MAG: hypothetical protein JSV34_03570 [Candidatus Omnitrophota bacterium]
MKELNEEEYRGKEKRKHPRIDANFMIKYGPRKQREQERDITHTKNISQGG